MATVDWGIKASESMGRRGIEPAVITSHSLGIYAALFAAGSLDVEGALSVAWEAGRLLKENLGRSPGALLAIVGLPEEEVESILGRIGGRLQIAARNAANQFVLGGTPKEIYRAQSECEDAIRVERIDSGGALHTDLVDAVVRPLEGFIGGLEVCKPVHPYLCHRGAVYLKTEGEVREALARQIREPILWSDCLRRLGREGAWLFVDMGPGSVLSRSVRWVLREARVLALSEGDTPEMVIDALRDGAPKTETMGK